VNKSAQFIVFEKGFTLIELLIVITIIAILSTIVIIVPIASTKKARDARREGDLKQYQSALEVYASRTGNGLYPSYTTATGKSMATGAGSLCSTLSLTNCPEDPNYVSNNTYQYLYQSDGDNSGGSVATKYVIWGKLEAVTNYFVLCSNGKSGSLPQTGWANPTAGACPL
jgi:prepilin-type N-terminal cleavage/methylation domain-containing protein